MRRTTIGWAAAALLAAAGCSGRDLHPVTGRVTYTDGTPFPDGRVEFEAVAPGPDGKRYAVGGGIGPDGRFVLGTFRVDDGAPVGEYRVAVLPHPPDKPVPGPGPIDAKYTDAATSGLRFEVKRGNNVCELVVERDPRWRPPAGKK